MTQRVKGDFGAFGPMCAIPPHSVRESDMLAGRYLSGADKVRRSKMSGYPPSNSPVRGIV
jgi:hypothetical protein